MKVEEFQIKKFPLVIFTDVHTKIEKIKILLSIYPNADFFSLGDFTTLFLSSPKHGPNLDSINFFIDNKERIHSIYGNHEEYILKMSIGDSLRKIDSSLSSEDFDLNQYQINFLSSLPRGFRLNLPNNHHILCFHYLPNNLWGSKDDLSEEEFTKEYPINSFTDFVFHGHLHKNFVISFRNIKTKRISIGSLGVNGDYLLVEEKRMEFQNIS